MKFKLILGLASLSIVACSQFSLVPQDYTNQGRAVEAKVFVDPVDAAVENDSYISSHCKKIGKITKIPLLQSGQGNGAFDRQVIINLKNATADMGGNFVAIERYRPHSVVKMENLYTGAGIVYKCN